MSPGPPGELRATLITFENGKIEVHRFFSIAVEPNERTDLLHKMNFYGLLLATANIIPGF